MRNIVLLLLWVSLTSQEFGTVINIQIGIEKRSGYVAGYAVIEYATRDEAQAAIEGQDGQAVLGQVVQVDWAFITPSRAGKRSSQGGDRQQENSYSRRRRN